MMYVRVGFYDNRLDTLAILHKILLVHNLHSDFYGYHLDTLQR